MTQNPGVPADVRLRWLSLHRLLAACEAVAGSKSLEAFWPSLCNNSRWVIKARRVCALVTDEEQETCELAAGLAGDTPVRPFDVRFPVGDDILGDAFACERSVWLSPSTNIIADDALRHWLFDDQPPALYVVALPGSAGARSILVFTVDEVRPEERRAMNALGLLYAQQAGTVHEFLESHQKLARSEAALQGQIRERERAEEKIREQLADLEKVNYQLDQFAHMVSHDLKAPVRAICNLSEWLAEDAAQVLTGETLEYLGMLQQRARKLTNMIEGMLHYSRAVRIVPNARFSDVDLNELVTEITELIGPPPGFRICVEGTLPVLFTDRAAMHQVFYNLIANAVRHHDRRDGKVRVSARDAGDHYEFAVADDGPGIDPLNQQRVFFLFQTGEKDSDQGESSGIGLAIVKRLVENQGGLIRLESTPGEGATFRFTWSKRQSSAGGNGVASAEFRPPSEPMVISDHAGP